MKINARITFKYKTSDNAKTAFKSLKPDNIGFIDSYKDNNCFICNLNGDSVGTVLATADDLLFCEMMVERITEFVEEQFEN
ncbi:KEOPS complex subunit Pcc1 [Methanobacterium paludis]|uniref:KEOPS complex Pcc1-like subunit n=1 Tax=Methanobacterium paludis (strain DSM 25820 / JCM 18151 / SWAN1) TaxID=868131 RepID=F6D1W8_METPW|nr:KEOPS complex subunit Pcc1 [Methanobacterium paludis]AEG19040.1 hypothetical protein MSWAN_2031 [Methanobacterium paludis]